jgi:phosphatidylinositol alpha-1,6-mannosyltransferase
VSRQRILIITRNLPPLVGGMERLNWHMADELSRYARVRVVGPKGSAATRPENVSIGEAPLKPLPLFLFVAFCKALWIALRWKPDLILAGSGLTAPLAWLISKLCGAHSAAYLHGFDITVPSKLYQRLWTPVFKKMDRIIVNSTPTKQLALAAGVPESRVCIIYPGVSLPNAPQPAEAIRAFKKKHGLEGKKILLSVGRLTTRKGLKEFVAQALPDIVRAVPDTLLVIIGEAPKHSLGAGIQTAESIEEQAEKSGMAKQIQFLGGVSEQELATAYEAADLHVFPVRDIPGDPEGFGMVAIEAAAHGLPTVAFATGGVVDAVKNGVSGYLVAKNDYDALARQIVNLLNKPIPPDAIQSFALTFAWERFGQAVKTELTDATNGVAEQINEKKIKRLPHVVTDLTSRGHKAAKIERILGLQPTTRPLQLLEVGFGSGGIAHYFATHPRLNCRVYAVDIHDNRQVFDGYSYNTVQGVELPFPSAHFDVVITNHVIEHVGDKKAQAKHLAEIHRVLKPTGTCYLAVPNRWMLVEPHYRLPLLSWWPHAWRSPYLRLMGKGQIYDCEPLQLPELEKMLDEADFEYRNMSIQAWRETFDIEHPDACATHLLRATPDGLLQPLKRVIPTLIYCIRRKQ